ncbi:MAG TPA: DMT family transporter [Syntrophomonadaceae bacterium]|nr:DMT family transporter [Syntrophomonadaceae bacterium]
MHWNKRITAELSMLLVAFIWGTTFVIVKNALADIGPFLFLGIRFIIAFLFLSLLFYKQLREITRSTIFYGCIIGVFLFIGYVFQTIGLIYTTSSNAGFITGLNVVIVPIIYALLHKRLPNYKIIFSVILASIGLFLLSLQGNNLNIGYGDSLVLVCAFGFAFHIIAVDRYSHQHNPIAITCVQILFVGLLCMGIGLATEPWPTHFSFNTVKAIMITSILATSLAFLLQNSMQKYSTPSRFAVVLATEPVFAAVAGYLWANEMFSERALVGAILILIAMLLAILNGRNETEV